MHFSYVRTMSTSCEILAKHSRKVPIPLSSAKSVRAAMSKLTLWTPRTLRVRTCIYAGTIKHGGHEKLIQRSLLGRDNNTIRIKRCFQNSGRPYIRHGIPGISEKRKGGAKVASKERPYLAGEIEKTKKKEKKWQHLTRAHTWLVPIYVLAVTTGQQRQPSPGLPFVTFLKNCKQKTIPH